MEFIASLDLSIIKWLNQYAQKSVAFDQIVREIADLDLIKGALFICLFWWAWFSQTGPRNDPEDDAGRHFVVRAVVGAAAAMIAGRVLQMLLPARSRPIHDPRVEFLPTTGMDPQTLQGWNSFPSDHAVFFFAMATAAFRWSRWLGAGAFLWAMLIICLPRVYLGIHYLSDIIGGAVIGVLIMLIAQRGPLSPRIFTTILAWERAHAAPFYALAFLVTYQFATLFNDVRDIASGTLKLLGILMSP